ncbi:AfsR/SARP family transcriptional regulator [Streptomyces marincola]|uniref:AfsR/SARP family transcriptional regulator n=1 Tax=Streptomyces marincola TaxID=2878388 RepID=UPI001CF5E0F3|nr:BTAD domain-containing putative transcriptional regulator [Streptomyces marincola]UCM86949.1 tetratricopeptide repeat protein [Streptomyces marincola]
MEFRILGGIDIAAEDGVRRLGSVKERIVLAVLALDVGRTVGTDTLIDRLWEEDVPAAPRENLRIHISRLRRRMGKPGGTHGSVVVQRDHGYVLDVAPERVDVHRYLHLVDRARHLVDRGDDEGAIEALDRAGPLWRGEPLAGVATVWAEEVRGTLRPRYLAAALTRSEIRLRRGHFADLVGELASLAGQYPHDQGVAEHLMLALYGCGRTSEALAAYQDIRRRLLDESGAEPDRRLRRVQEGVLRDVPVDRLLPGASGTSSRLVGHLPPSNLPAPSALVGRTAERALLRSALERGGGAPGGAVALESIEGMSGVGKTALAFSVGHEVRDLFPDGQVYVNLRAHAGGSGPLSPAAALDFLLRRLGTPTERIPADADSAASLWRAMLARRRLLVILDDAADPEQIRPILPGDSPSAVVVTSRRRLLGLPGVRRIALSTLPEPEAVALFQRLVPDERTRDTVQVADLMRAAGHLPLAIEILAGRLNSHPLWSLADLKRRLLDSEARLSEFRDGYREIGRTFEFSYRWLTGEQQTVFRRLGLHMGPDLTPDAAAALTGLGIQRTEHVLEDLLNHYLVQELAPHRYSAHDLLREYAQMLAETEDSEAERAAAVGGLIDWYLSRADAADRMLYPYRSRTPLDGPTPRQTPVWRDAEEARAWLAAERENLLAAAEQAWRTGPRRRAALFAHVLAGYHDRERLGPAGRRLMERAADHWSDADAPAEKARALIDLCGAHTVAGSLSDALSTAEKALELARAIGDEEIIAEALSRLGQSNGFSGRDGTAARLHREALDIRMRSGQEVQIARSRNNLAISLLALGRSDAALELFRAALEGFLAARQANWSASVYNNLGDLYRARQEYVQARSFYDRALPIMESRGDVVSAATVRMNIAQMLRDTGALAASCDLYRDALSAFRLAGDRRRESVVLTGIGGVFRVWGKWDEAVSYCRQAIEVSRSIGAAREEMLALLELSLTASASGDRTMAVEHAEAALEVAQRNQVEVDIGRVRDQLAALR